MRGVGPDLLIRGLYAITPDETDTRLLLANVTCSLRGGATLLQYRNKRAKACLRRQQAGELAQVCRAHGALFIVNDDVELAEASNAHGVHLGTEDGDLVAARRRLGPGKLLGASCYNRLELAVAAHAAGADYVAFGAAFNSTIKPSAVNAPLELFQRAKRTIGLPVVAIGGITLDNAGTLIAAGVDSVAVITALFSATDIEACAARFSALFNSPQN
jgi:thiamine-phosphate pyrophosphorylase